MLVKNLTFSLLPLYKSNYKIIILPLIALFLFNQSSEAK